MQRFSRRAMMCAVLTALSLGVLSTSACGGPKDTAKGKAKSKAKDNEPADVWKRDATGWPGGFPKVPGAKLLKFEPDAAKSFTMEFSAPGSGGKTIFWYRGHLGPIGWVSKDGEYMTDDNSVWHIEFSPRQGLTGSLSMTIDQTESGDSHVTVAYTK